MKYAIRVEETLGRTIIVDAEDLLEAIQKVEDACNDGEISLGFDDFDSREVTPSKWFKNGIISDNEDVSFYEHLES